MNDNFVGFQDGIVDFLGIDFGVFEDTFERSFDRFEIIGRFFFDGHFYILPKYFYFVENTNIILMIFSLSSFCKCILLRSYYIVIYMNM